MAPHPARPGCTAPSAAAGRCSGRSSTCQPMRLVSGHSAIAGCSEPMHSMQRIWCLVFTLLAKVFLCMRYRLCRSSHMCSGAGAEQSGEGTASAPAAPTEWRAVVRIVIQCCHELLKAPACIALLKHALGETVLCVHDCAVAGARNLSRVQSNTLLSNLFATALRQEVLCAVQRVK